MDKQRRIRLDLLQPIGMAIALFSLLVVSCGGPLPGSPQGRIVLPMPDADVVRVQPGGRLVIFWSATPPEGLTVLDVSTEEREFISKDILRARWLDDELLYGEGFLPTTTQKLAYYVINLQPAAAVRLKPLDAGSESLPQRVAEADSIYTSAPGSANQKYLLLLLRLDADHRVIGGYVVEDVRSLNSLLADRSYKTAPPEFPYNKHGEKYPSPDGSYYYICYGFFHALEIYSQQGELLSFADPESRSSEPWLNCYGWAWDSHGVFFQEQASGPAIGNPYIGPLQLLEVKQ